MDDDWWCITENRKEDVMWSLQLMILRSHALSVKEQEKSKAAHVQLAAGRVSF